MESNASLLGHQGEVIRGISCMDCMCPPALVREWEPHSPVSTGQVLARQWEDAICVLADWRESAKVASTNSSVSGESPVDPLPL